MSSKHKKVHRGFNYIDHLLIFFSTISGWVFASAFAFLIGVSIGITSYVNFAE